MFVLPFHRLLSASAFPATAFPHVAGTAIPADDFGFGLTAPSHGYFFPRFRRPLRPPLWLMRFPRSAISNFPIMVCSFR
jgi:hypothetical protein